MQEQYNRQKASLDALADQFARVNFDDVDSLYRQALELFKAGAITACRKKLEQADLLHRTDLRLQERVRIDSAQATLARQEADNEKGLRDDIQSIRLLTQTYLLSFEFAKAEMLYDQLLRLDSTNLEILREAAIFYYEHQYYDKVLHWLPHITTHPQAEQWQRSLAYTHLGEMHTATGRLPEAIQAYGQFWKINKALFEQDSSNSFYKHNLAVSYERLGSTHTSLGHLEQALGFFQDDNQLFKELYAAYPQNADFKNGLAISCIRSKF